MLSPANSTGCKKDLFFEQEKMAALSENDLAKLIREGGEGLKAFPADLTDDQVYAVAGYLRSLSFAAPAPFAAQPDVQSPAGTPTAASHCRPGHPCSRKYRLPIAPPGAESTAVAAVPSGRHRQWRGHQ